MVLSQPARANFLLFLLLLLLHFNSAPLNGPCALQGWTTDCNFVHIPEHSHTFFSFCTDMGRAAKASRAGIDESDVYAIVKRTPVGGIIYSATRGIEKAFAGKNKQSLSSLFDMYGALVRDTSPLGGPGTVAHLAC